MSPRRRWSERYGPEDQFDAWGCVLPVALAGTWLAAVAAVVWAIVRWT